MAQVAIVSTDTREEAWAKETLNNSDLQTNIDAKITGPASAVDNNIPIFDGTTGKLVSDSGATIDTNGLNLPAVATPKDSFNSSDSLDANKLVAQLRSVVTTTTAGVVVSDLYLSYKDGTNASGVVADALHIDGSAGLVNLLIPLSAPTLTPVTDAAADFAANFTGRDLYGGTFNCDVTGIIQLPVGVEGMNFCIDTITAIAITVNPDDNDSILLDGTQLADGISVVNLSTAGDLIYFQYNSVAGWKANSNDWTAGS